MGNERCEFMSMTASDFIEDNNDRFVVQGTPKEDSTDNIAEETFVTVWSIQWQKSLQQPSKNRPYFKKVY